MSQIFQFLKLFLRPENKEENIKAVKMVTGEIQEADSSRSYIPRNPVLV